MLGTVLALWIYIDHCLNPVKPLESSPSTTFVEVPMYRDGRFDFSAYLLELDRPKEINETTAKENAAAKIWQAIGTKIINEEDRISFFDELKISVPKTDGLLDCREEAGQFVNDGSNLENHIQLQLNELIQGVDNANEDLRLTQVMLHLRTKLLDKQLISKLELDRWALENANDLELLREIEGCSYFYSPSPELLNGDYSCLFETTLPCLSAMGSVCKIMSYDVMRLVSQGEVDSAYRSWKSLGFLANEMGSSSGMIGAVISCKILENSFLTLPALLQCSDGHQLRSIYEFLNDTEEPNALVQPVVVDGIFVVDQVLHNIEHHREMPLGEVRNQFAKEAFMYPWGVEDSNEVLRVICRRYQKVIGVIQNKNRVDRRAILGSDEFNKNLYKVDFLSTSLNSLTRKGRSLNIAKLYLLTFEGSHSALANAEDRAADQLRLMRTAAALKVWQLEHGSYPKSLEALVPEVLSTLPTCASWEKPLIYERRNEGFLLYAVGINGIDDNANDSEDIFNNGDYAPIDWFDTLPPRKETGDDIVIRLPVPELNLPPAPVVTP